MFTGNPGAAALSRSHPAREVAGDVGRLVARTLRHRGPSSMGACLVVIPILCIVQAAIPRLCAGPQTLLRAILGESLARSDLSHPTRGHADDVRTVGSGNDKSHAPVITAAVGILDAIWQTTVQHFLDDFR
jgi:hypothetical protein